MKSDILEVGLNHHVVLIIIVVFGKDIMGVGGNVRGEIEPLK